MCSSDLDEKVKKLIVERLGTSNIEGLADAISESGAPIHVEDLIEKLAESALEAIQRDELELEAKQLLNEMVELVTKRSR